MGLRVVSGVVASGVAWSGEARALTVDVHVSSDGVILMFHDPTLDRTTNGKGTIRSQAWKDGIELVLGLRQ